MVSNGRKSVSNKPERINDLDSFDNLRREKTEILSCTGFYNKLLYLNHVLFHTL